MPIFHDVPQYSEEYDRLKLGLPTSSYFHKIITPQGKPSKQWREYACMLIAERVLQRKIDLYKSLPMERGLIVEAEAADWYEFDQDVTVQRGREAASSLMITTRSGAVLIDSSATKACWKSRPPYRRLKSSIGFPERSMNVSGPNCKVSSMFPSEAGSISYAGMTCFQKLSCGLSRIRSSSRPSTASCKSSTSSSRGLWKRSMP